MESELSNSEWGAVYVEFENFKYYDVASPLHATMFNK